MILSRDIDKVLICSITPYFLEKGNFWIEENEKELLRAGKTQAFFQENMLSLEKTQKINLSEVLRKVDEMGYEKVLDISFPGEFSQKGGVIEVFPVNLSHAVRLDFLGNEIENIEKIDIKTEDEESAKEILRKRLKSQKLFSDLKGLKEGDYLVHLDHGIGRYKEKTTFDNQEYYILEYAAGDKLYVPVGLERKLSRYISFTEPRISRLGSSLWQRTKKRVREEAEKLAKELLGIAALREITSRPPYLADDELDKQLALSFPYQETPDQMQAMEDIKRDLQKTKPMDRIICGDVGFGKTELAIRSALMAAKSGYQVAVIAPTTILADQHFKSFKDRLKNIPVTISLISRLLNQRQQKETIDNLKSGKTDIVIGTHRLLSNDVDFKNLGLLIIDDEQRFGVRQKEKLKKLRSSLDILSLSATPIPRTLYLSLSSLKDISLIQTPPVGRIPIAIETALRSKKIIKEAVEKELERDGQVYYLHNRVQNIELIKSNLQELIPKAKFAVVHGRLKDKELINIMENFQDKKLDVLIATTIIENGLDLPNVNTLIVADASRLGLAQAYQLKGRVGRSDKQAYAYFLHGKKMTDKSKLRMKALKESKELGSGYRIALRDMEIRGAGNILGKEQSGSINQVGLNLYCQMLSEAISKRSFELSEQSDTL
ncbi:MAG: DEAD/DEAH box helicase [Candidatus Paceibacterota bacterium]|jgi:transcription-repair coupling factor (superfamily II helicase)